MDHPGLSWQSTSLSLLRQSAWHEAATPDFDREEPPLVIEQQLSMLLDLDFDIGKALSQQ
jgi:hypothetical protein